MQERINRLIDLRCRIQERYWDLVGQVVEHEKLQYPCEMVLRRLWYLIEDKWVRSIKVRDKRIELEEKS